MITIEIAFVAPGFPPDIGGVEAVVGHLATELHRAGESITVLAQTSRRTRSTSTVDQQENFVIKRFPDWLGNRRYPTAPGLWRAVHAGQSEWDLINAHSFHTSPSLAAAVLTDRPFVFTPHYHGVGHTPAARALHRIYDVLALRIFERALSVICVSQAEAGMLAEDYPAVTGRIRVIPNGVDVAEIESAVPFDVDRRVVLMAGRLEAYKQIEVAIRAASRLSDDVLLVIAGSGVEETRLRNLANSLGLHDRVCFLGFVDTATLRRWQRTAAVTLTLSRHEAFGLTLLEGIVAGSHIVATDLAAHREVTALIQSQAAIDWVPVDVAPDDLAEIIAEGIARPALANRGEMSRLGWDHIARLTLDCFQSALRGTL